MIYPNVVTREAPLELARVFAQIMMEASQICRFLEPQRSPEIRGPAGRFLQVILQPLPVALIVWGAGMSEEHENFLV